MYVCSLCHEGLGTAYQYWRCLGTRPHWDNPSNVWYYQDAFGNYCIAMCVTCYTEREIAALALADHK